MTENKYHNGKIYTIRSHKTDKFYIGSTCQPLHKRLHAHRGGYKLYKEGKVNNVSSYIILEHDDNYIELLETFKCESKYELEKREGELIRQHRDNCINRCIAGRTQSERDYDNRDKISERKKKWRNDNKELNASIHKQYYNDNKERIITQAKQLYKCQCGTELQKGIKARHERTKKHIEFITKNLTIEI